MSMAESTFAYISNITNEIKMLEYYKNEAIDRIKELDSPTEDDIHSVLDANNLSLPSDYIKLIQDLEFELFKLKQENEIADIQPQLPDSYWADAIEQVVMNTDFETILEVMDVAFDTDDVCEDCLIEVVTELMEDAVFQKSFTTEAVTVRELNFGFTATVFNDGKIELTFSPDVFISTNKE